MDMIPANGHHNGRQKKSKAKFASAAIVAVALLIIALIGGWILYRSNSGSVIDAGKYQAVFFTNGQVYFGKLQKLNGGYYKLNDVFYLQTQAATPDAAEDGSENPQETSDQQSSDMQLIKLGSEIHGPEDEMIINRDQILFFENLKKDGKVTDSISNYKG